MPLLGWPLLATIAVLLVVGVAVTVWLWPRTAGRSPHHLAGRVGLVALNQVMAILLVAVALNNYGYFYGTWADLLGGPSGPTTVRHVSDAGSQVSRSAFREVPSAAMPSTTAQSWSTPAQYATRGKLETVQITGVHSGLSNPVMVYLPPQYFQPRYAHTLFPAVELMTGYPGVMRALVDSWHYPDKLLNEMGKHRAGPMVLVMLRPTVAPPRDTECTDVPGGPLALTYLAEDVPSAVEHLARVRPVGWGAMGDSTGGYCAVKIAMTHPYVFTSAVSLSGYYHTLRDFTTGDLWGGSLVLRHLNDLEWLLAHQPAPPVSVLATIGAGEHGSNGLGDTRKFLSLVRRPMSADVIVQPHGGHNFTTWRQVLPIGLDWLSRHLRA